MAGPVVRGKRRRAQTVVERGLTAAARQAPVDARARIDVDRVPAGPRCQWCGTPVERRPDGSQARCGCGLP